MYVSTIKGGVLSVLIFSLLSYLVPLPNIQTEGVEVVLTISTFLFAILIGFFMSRLNSRYNEVRDAVANEDSFFVSLYELTQYFDEEVIEQVKELMDRYYIKSYDHILGMYYKVNAKEMHDLYQVFENAKLDDTPNGKEIYDVVVATLGSIEINRNKSSVLSNEGMRVGQWLMILMLGTIIVFSLFIYGIDTTYFHVITILISSTIIIIFLIMLDLQNFRLGGTLAVGESGQEVFEMIGRPRYYNKLFLDQGLYKIPITVKTYRLGTHKPGEAFQIQLIKRS